MTTQTDQQYEQHAYQLLTGLALLRRDAVHCDVLLQVDKTASKTTGVWAHRVILAAASPFFYDMFKTSLNMCSMQVITLKGLDLQTLQELVENLYLPAPVMATVERATSLLAAATMLVVDDVRDAACICLAQALAADNVLGIRATAERYGCDALVTATKKYIYDHFENVLQSDEFLALVPGELSAFLDRERAATMEKHVFDAVLRWTLHRPQERRQHLSSLLQAVRLRLISREMLGQRARVEPLSSEQKPLLQIAEALAPVYARAEHPTPIVMRSQNMHPAKLLIIGGKTGLSVTTTTLVCSLPDGIWQSGDTLPAPRTYADAALLGGKVYLVGGYDARAPVDTVFVYDVATDSWSKGPAMNKARSNLGVAALDSRLYMVGGWSGLCTLNSAQALDPREGIWRSIASMAKNRRGLGVAALEGRLYAIGGYDNNNELNSCERYDPVADKWQIVEAMAERRETLGVAVVDNAIYAVGGWNGSTRLRSVERYRPGWIWESAPSMAMDRDEMAVAAHGSKLYVTGGYDDSLKCHKTVSVLDTVSSVWSELAILSESRAAAVAIVIPW